MSARGPAAAARGLVCAAAFVTLSCFSDRPAPLQPVDGDDCRVPASAIGPGRAVVLVRGFAFAQDTLRVRAGSAVTWVNCEAANVEAHTSTAVDGIWDSGSFGPGEAWSRIFDDVGTFEYFCRPHPHMRGVIIVS